ncbi:MAG TPA: HD domain-containing phosphohydrolase [Spirochaetia bacterium]|nr:HD domain-containing phosphohydrolase [Spirochaetia bacterium]
MLLATDAGEPGCPEDSNLPIQVILVRMKAWDETLYKHARLTARLAVSAGEILELSREERFYLITGALLHDTGKILWPPEMSYKSRLTPADLVLVRTHPESGYRHVQAHWPQVPAETLTIIRQHHERADGSGYPAGLSGHQIHPLAKIVAALEAYAAMTEARTYRNYRFNHFDAMSELLLSGHPERLVNLIHHLA